MAQLRKRGRNSLNFQPFISLSLSFSFSTQGGNFPVEEHVRFGGPADAEYHRRIKNDSAFRNQDASEISENGIKTFEVGLFANRRRCRGEEKEAEEEESTSRFSPNARSQLAHCMDGTLFFLFLKNTVARCEMNEKARRRRKKMTKARAFFE